MPWRVMGFNFMLLLNPYNRLSYYLLNSTPDDAVCDATNAKLMIWCWVSKKIFGKSIVRATNVAMCSTAGDQNQIYTQCNPVTESDYFPALYTAS